MRSHITAKNWTLTPSKQESIGSIFWQAGTLCWFQTLMRETKQRELKFLSVMKELGCRMEVDKILLSVLQSVTYPDFP